MKPQFSETELQNLALEYFGLDGQVKQLESYMDQNAKIKTKNGSYVLKVAHPEFTLEELHLQNAAMEYLKNNPALKTPAAVPSKTNEKLVKLPLEKGGFFMRAVPFLEGQFWADLHPLPTPFFYELGKSMALFNLAFDGFHHPHQNRKLNWNLTQTPKVDPNPIQKKQDRELVQALLQLYLSQVEPKLEFLPWAVIHNDFNDYNVLVDPETLKPTAVIDFGDMDYAPRICDLAIAAAYAVLDQPDPLNVIRKIVSGWHDEFPLKEVEVQVFWPMLVARLCMSVCHSAKNKLADPDNEYLSVSEAPAWRFLHGIAKWPDKLVEMAIRCELKMPDPGLQAFESWLNRATFHPVMSGNLHESIWIDLSGQRPDLMPQKGHIWSDVISNALSHAQAPLGLGGYGENRKVYDSPVFQGGLEPRTVHLGLDIFAPAGTPVFAPFDAEVHSFQNNAGELDYGPTIILKSNSPHGSFFTLLGHLSIGSLKLSVGQKIDAGEQVATLGDEAVNGGWPPHLHLQIILSEPKEKGNFPGVSGQSHADAWLALCPNPEKFLQLPALLKPPGKSPQIMERRKKLLGPSLSLAYDGVQMIRGQGQYLYDATGRAYLDCVNNVPHVGHCHPKVVDAGQKQMARLNTNTRYLHDTVLDLAENLLAYCPDPLRVCYFVNSGSEANDLAYRLAQAFTGNKQVICQEYGYHGNLSSLIDFSPYKCLGKGGNGLGAHVSMIPLDLNDALKSLNQVEKPAMFISEAILSCAGQVPVDRELLQAVAARVRQNGGLYVADEVQTGLGRIGSHFWAFESLDVVPDILTIGKPLGNGHPIAAVITRPEIANSFHNGMEYFNTFGGNPVSAAIALSVLQVIENEGLMNNATQVGGYLKSALQSLKSPWIREVRGSGLFLGIEFDSPQKEQPHLVAKRLVQEMFNKGFLLSTDGPLNNVIKIKPPLCFNEENAANLSHEIEKSLRIM